MLLVLVGILSYKVLQQYINDKKVTFTAPDVIINYPEDGTTVISDSLLPVNITAMGSNPIARLEMWLDGANTATHIPILTVGDSNLTIIHTFHMAMQEGAHLLYFQAIDSLGLVGQSVPITIMATPIISSAVEEAGAIPPGSEEPIDLPPSGTGETSDTLLQGDFLPSGDPQSQDASLPDQEPIKEETNTNVPMLIKTILPVIDVNSVIAAMLSHQPNAPSDFNAVFEKCRVRLTWFDNADDETQFKVWMQRIGGPVRLIKTLESSPGNGLAWFEFDAPAIGNYSFWVEAANALGGNPSQKVFVAINDASCKQDALATQLEIKALDMYIFQNSEEIYCYLTVDGASQQRIPEDSLSYIKVFNQWADITSYWGGEKHILLPIPTNDVILLDGECLGYTGNMPLSLGRFHEEIPMEYWNGSRLELNGDGFRVGYLIRLFGTEEAQGYYTFEDTSILQPNFLYMKVKSSSDPSENARLGRTPELHWTWNGSPQNISGFNILLDGKFFRWAAPEYNWTTLRLPTSCGKTYIFQVVAVSGEAQSTPSPVLYYVQPQCEIYAEVKFETFTFTSTDNGGCEELDSVTWNLGVDDQFIHFGSYGYDTMLYTWKKGCGTYNFLGHTPTFPGSRKPPGDDNTFIVPLSAEKSKVRITADFGNAGNNICSSYSYAEFPITTWPEVDMTVHLPCPFGVYDSYGRLLTGSGDGYIVVNIRGIASPLVP